MPGGSAAGSAGGGPVVTTAGAPGRSVTSRISSGRQSPTAQSGLTPGQSTVAAIGRTSPIPGPGELPHHPVSHRIAPPASPKPPEAIVPPSPHGITGLAAVDGPSGTLRPGRAAPLGRRPRGREELREYGRRASARSGQASQLHVLPFPSAQFPAPLMALRATGSLPCRAGARTDRAFPSGARAVR
ncbi:hypothetical protein GCM10020229_23140 [Kitasatospora albolonga]